MNLKNILKAIKLNESTVSMILGALVIIVVGVFVVNYFKDAEQAGQIPAEGTQVEAPVEVGETYTVAEGENLWEIAERAYGSGYNWVDIAEVNSLLNPDSLNAGQELIIPDVSPKEATIETVLLSDESVGTIPEETYEVRIGDNLWDIAVRAYGDGYRWVDIARENNLANPDIIHQGNILILPR